MIKKLNKNTYIITERQSDKHLTVLLKSHGFNDIYSEMMYVAKIGLVNPDGYDKYCTVLKSGIGMWDPIAKFNVNLDYIPMGNHPLKLDLMAVSALNVSIDGPGYQVGNEIIGSSMASLRQAMHQKVSIISRGIKMLHKEFIPYAKHHKILKKAIDNYTHSRDLPSDISDILPM